MIELARHKKVGEYDLEFELLVGKSNIDQARSMVASKFYLEHKKGDKMLFIDADHVFTYHDVLKIAECDAPLCGIIYPNRAGRPNIHHNGDGTVKCLGTGFMGIKWETLDAVYNNLEDKTGYSIESTYPCVYSFFKQICVDGKWLGEDYSFCHRVTQCGLKIEALTSGSMCHEVSILRCHCPPDASTFNKKSIVWYCGMIPIDPNQVGLGGSEQALFYLSDEWTKKGYNVTIYYNGPDIIHNGIRMRHYQRFNPDLSYETLLLWRSWGIDILPKLSGNNRLVAIDMHDGVYGRALNPELNSKYHYVFAKSNHHALDIKVSMQVPTEKIMVCPNGLRISMLDQYVNKKKKEKTFCYTSCYGRGLVDILRKWKDIHEQFPDAQLHIAYGLNRGVPDYVEINKLLRELKDKNVFEYGRLSAEAVTNLRSFCKYHLYPCNTLWTETDCIAIRESAYLNTVPICPDFGVFKERNCLRTDDFVQTVLDICKGEIEPTLEKTKEVSWENVADRWLSVLYA